MLLTQSLSLLLALPFTRLYSLVQFNAAELMSSLTLIVFFSASPLPTPAPWRQPLTATSPRRSAVAVAAGVGGASSASLPPGPPCRHGDWASPAPVCRRGTPPPRGMATGVVLWEEEEGRGGATCTLAPCGDSWRGGEVPSVWIWGREGRILTWRASPWR